MRGGKYDEVLIGARDLFWSLASLLRAEDPRIVEGVTMGGRCLRLGRDFLALVEDQRFGLVVRLAPGRVEELVQARVGQAYSVAGRRFGHWLAVPVVDARIWMSLLREAVRTLDQEPTMMARAAE